MLEAESQSTTYKIDNKRPLEIGVTISAHESDSWTDCAKFVQNPFCADVSQVPDFICISRHLADIFRQTIVRISQNENPWRRSSLSCSCHSRRDTDQVTTANGVAGELARPAFTGYLLWGFGVAVGVGYGQATLPTNMYVAAG